MHDYHLFGWRVQSALPLPELLPWRGDARGADLVIEVGTVPPVDPRLPSFSPALQIGSPVATYWVEAGRRVIIEPASPEDARNIRVFLLGSVLAILCFQRGLLPLHASGIDIGGRVLLLSGVSGAGKSTLAAAFSARGYRLLSDDLCALDVEEGHPLKVLPAFPRLKLWHDSARQLGLSTGDPDDAQEKWNVPLEETHFQPEALPPAQVVFLRTDPLPGRRRPRQLVGVEAVRRFDLVHRWRLGVELGCEALIFKGMARLAGAVPVVEVARSDDLADLPALVDSILALTKTRHE